jgi:HEAT repeat protein
MRSYSAVVFALLSPLALLCAQDVHPKDVRDIAKNGSSAIPQLTQLLKNPAKDVRLEVVRQLTDIGGQGSLDPLIQATRDADPEVQARAADGLTNFYYPGYAQQSGVGGSLKRIGTGIKGMFTDTDDQVIDAYVIVRPEVISALGKLASSGGSAETRAGAARAVGVLRGKAAVPDLVEAVHSKDTGAIYEALVALQKIRDESAGPRVEFRLHDLDKKVQTAAIDTVGVLRDTDALPALADILKRSSDAGVRHAALSSIAMMPAESSRPLYEQYLRDKDEKMRAAAAEGYARLRDAKDLPMLQQAWKDEGKTAPRLSLAFAQVMLGDAKVSQFSPLQFLIDNLNSASYSGVAMPFLVELARDSAVRNSLYPALPGATKDEKIGLAHVLARSGDQQSIPALQKLSTDRDSDVAQEGLRALRTLQAKM